MLTAMIRVAHGEDPTAAATQALLHQAHLKRVHLARPLTPTITPMSGSVQQLAEILGIAPDAHLDFYRAESDTIACPAT
ncbi:hypothetical protein SAMN05421870_107240 [Streptomyces qinglanensis]|uniref:Uncharacterized protein n=2 Tax=Streptomyces qinglanensis TaxID=943816 RepID=A0A1H9U2K5_9ACTN|nr:hypothetical protein SAMN05421870_107240 [Streptomyces qinglanensis]